MSIFVINDDHWVLLMDFLSLWTHTMSFTALSGPSGVSGHYFPLPLSKVNILLFENKGPPEALYCYFKMAVFIAHHFLPKRSDKTDCLWRDITDITTQFHLSLLSHNIIIQNKKINKNKEGGRNALSTQCENDPLFCLFSKMFQLSQTQFLHAFYAYSSAWCHWHQMPLVLVCPKLMKLYVLF